MTGLRAIVPRKSRIVSGILTPNNRSQITKLPDFRLFFVLRQTHLQNGSCVFSALSKTTKSAFRLVQITGEMSCLGGPSCAAFEKRGTSFRQHNDMPFRVPEAPLPSQPCGTPAARTEECAPLLFRVSTAGTDDHPLQPLRQNQKWKPSSAE